MKPMLWQDKDGQKYKISFSEELQLKNLKAVKENTEWQKRHFYMKILLLLIGVATIATMLYVLYQLDKVNFFTGILYK